MMFGQYPEETQSLYENAATHPYDPAGANAGIFTGLGRGVAQGYEAGGNQLLMLGTDALAGVDKTLGFDAAASGLTDWRKASLDLASSLDPDPHTIGFAGRVLGGVAQTVPTFLGATLAGGPVGGAAAVGATAGYTDFRLGQNQGLDTTTAAEKAIITGAAATAGTLLPVGVGSTALAKIGTGALGNVVFGAGQREATSALLSSRGFEDMAKQYKPMDAASIGADAVLGAAFGGVAHLHVEHSPSDIDAAMMAKNAQSLEVDSAPGAPLTPETRQSHIDAIKQATDQLMRGEPVDVSDVINHDMNFSLDPSSPLAASSHDFASALRDAGLHDEAETFEQGIAQREDAFQMRSGKLDEVQGKLRETVNDIQNINNDLTNINDQISSQLTIAEKISLVDPITGERMQELRAEIEDPSTNANRRQTLMAQENMLINGRNWSEIPKAVAERQERLQKAQSDVTEKLRSREKDATRYTKEIAKRTDKLKPVAKEKPADEVSAKDNQTPPSDNVSSEAGTPRTFKSHPEQVIAEKPDMQIVTGEVDAEGNPETISAKDAQEREANLDKDADIQKNMVQAAVNCFLKFGG